MEQITKAEIKRVHALASGAGLLQGGQREDLHALVEDITGKTSVSALTSGEFKAVEKELMARMRFGGRTAPVKSRPKTQRADQPAPGMMNQSQQSLAWRLIYRLMELDPHSSATAGERMLGAVKKILGIDARLEAPFKWVNEEQGGQLINQLKRYVRSAEAKAAKGAVSNGKGKQTGANCAVHGN